ncbi:MAG: DUF1189 domain-containing protein [Chitinispirillales bacterium]|nr:DUF1189 domain-containing protein [Chitinispirillales bacterium]
MAVSFFSDLHKSIFDLGFYREAVKRSRGRVVMFMLKLLVLTALVTGVSKTYYLLHSERGVAPLISAVFSGMEIVDGRLVTELEQPYDMSGVMPAELLGRLMGYPHLFERTPKNFLVVDTRTPPVAYEGADAPHVLLGETSVEFRVVRMEIPYKNITGSENFQFTASAVQGVLNRNAVSFALQFFMGALFFGFFTMMISAFFLSLAAYIFAIDRRGGYGRFARLASYAITPVMLGSALVAVSGVSAEWTWHVFIIISTIIMFRAMTRLSLDKTSEEKSEVHSG